VSKHIHIHIHGNVAVKGQVVRDDATIFFEGTEEAWKALIKKHHPTATFRPNMGGHEAVVKGEVVGSAGPIKSGAWRGGYRTHLRNVKDANPDVAGYRQWAKAKGYSDPQSRTTFIKYVREMRLNPNVASELESAARIGRAAQDASEYEHFSDETIIQKMMRGDAGAKAEAKRRGIDKANDATPKAYIRTTPTEYELKDASGKVLETYPRTPEGKRRADMEAAEMNKVKDAVAPNSPLERANRMISAIRQYSSKLREVTGERGADGGTINDAQNALKLIKDHAEAGLRLLG